MPSLKLVSTCVPDPEADRIRAMIPKPAALALVLLVLVAAPAAAQQQPFIVHDTRPVVMHGPWISSLTETSATMVWVFSSVMTVPTGTRRTMSFPPLP